LPHQCAHWFAMTAEIYRQSHRNGIAVIGTVQIAPTIENLPGKTGEVFVFTYSSQVPTVLGNGSTSRMLPMPVRYITQRSKPRPKPA